METGDAPFILDLLNQPSFIRHIGDRGVRTVYEARAFIDNRYRQSYLDNGFGLYTVELKPDYTPIGICGFVKRPGLDDPDLGFALLPEFEGFGYAFEAARATLDWGRTALGFERVMAITTVDNDRSGRLLEKLGFAFEERVVLPGSEEELNLYGYEYE